MSDVQIPKDIVDAFDGDEFRASVFVKKYALKDRDGNILERKPQDMWRRISSAVASVEKDSQYWSGKFYYAMEDWKFIPAGRILFGAGNKFIPKNTLLNCFVNPIKEDSLEGIYDCAKEMARTYSWGGGVGVDISILRPAKSPVLNSARHSTGAVSFMHLFSLTTGLIGQEGRRGALMITIDVTHPDIELFIYAKSKPDFFTMEVLKQNSWKYTPEQLKLIEEILVNQQVKFANISVKIRDDFMRAVEEDGEWELWYPDIVREKELSDSELEKILDAGAYISYDRITTPYDVPLYRGKYLLIESQTGEIELGGRRWELRKKRVYRTVRARELWHKIVESVYYKAEPGLLFWDNMLREHNPQYFQPLLATNPCAEKPLPAYGNCDLGSLNLTRFVDREKKDWNWELLSEIIPIAVRFLDDVIDYSRYPLPQQEKASKDARRIGLGILGLGDALAMMEVRYDSEEALSKVESLMKFIRDTAYRYSVELAKEKGPFPYFDFERWSQSEFVKRLPADLLRDIKQFGIRNSELISIAPTGSISILGGNVSSGIEPIFSFKYTRYSLGEFFNVYHPLVKEYLGKSDEEITEEDLKSLPDYFVTAYDINWDYRVRLQGLIQKYVDSAISSTINLPKETSIDTVKELYMMAWKEGTKGITIYREGSREGILIANDKKEEETSEKEEKPATSAHKPTKKQRPFAVRGVTYKIKYKGRTWYVTVNEDDEGRPFEIFAHSSDMVGLEWSTALSMMISAVLRRTSVTGDDPRFIVENLFKVKEIQGQGYMYRGYYIPSEPAVLGLALKLFLEGVKNGNLDARGELKDLTFTFVDEQGNIGEIKPVMNVPSGERKEEVSLQVNLNLDADKLKDLLEGAEICPACGNRTLIKGGKAKMIANCSTYCLSCGYSVCD